MSTKANISRTALSDVLFLYTTKNEEPLTFTYEVECTTFKAAVFTLNFEGSENFSIEGKKGDTDMKLTTTIRPFTRTELGKIELISDDRRAALKMGCEWIMKEPSENETSEYLKINQANMAKILQDAKTMNFPTPHEDPHNKKVHQLCKTYGKKFVDKDFLPNLDALYKKGSKVNEGPDASVSTAKRTLIEWKRPGEFLEDHYQVFEGGIDPADIRQGALGDCWFLCAIAALTEFPELVLNLFPKDSQEANEDGVYRVKFCKNGLWQSVRIDDYFPCYPGGGPLYSRSNGNELWVMLMEKAFAKICGSYEAIKSGWAYEAMMDMTGAPCSTIRFDDSEVRPKIETGELWELIKQYDECNYIMSASTPGEDIYTETGKRPGKNHGTGLVAGHAYTLIAAKQSSKGDKLVKLRNPWGSMEWTGDWSDSSPLWTQQMQDEIEPLVESDDGTFWMSFEDLVIHFYSVNVCMVRGEAYHSSPWKEQRRKFHYEYDADEATPESHRINVPIYILNVAKEGEFIATVHQEDVRIEGAKPYIDIGVSVMKANPVYGTFTLMAGTGNSVERQNGTELFNLAPGKYVVVPTTTGVKLKQALDQPGGADGTEAAEAVSLTKKNPEGEVEFSDACIEAYSELFERLDTDNDGYLQKAELDQYMMRTEGSPIQDTAFHWLLNNFESREAPGLTKAGFIKAQQFVFKHTGGDEEKLRNEFKIMGFNANLKLESGRSSVLAVHSSVEFTLEMAPFDDAAYEEAIELPAIASGEKSSFEDGKINMYKFRSGYGGMSFVVENKHHAPLVFVLDCSESKNVVSHRGDLKFQETVPPNEAKVLHHLLPLNDSGSWSWAYSASYMWDE